MTSKIITEKPEVISNVPETNPEMMPVVATPAYLLQMAVEQGADIDKLSKLMDLQERWEEREAKKDYVAALASFSANVPPILKTRTAHKTKYAGLAETLTAIKPTMEDNGLIHTWITSQEGGQITVRCIVTHISGHSEETSLSSGSDDSGSKNDIQAIGSTVKYLQRYTLYAILGLASADDDDGNAAGKKVETITEDQCLTIESLVNDHDLDSLAIHDYLKQAFGIEHIDELPASRFRAVIRKINCSIEAKDGRESGSDG